MIRFVRIGDRIYEDDDSFDFIWYDTVIDKVLTFNGSNTWDVWWDFEYDFEKDTNSREYDLDRFRRLYPGDKVT